MAAAYAYADGGPPSAEIKILGYIDRFGAQAIYGHAMSAREVRSLVMAENIVDWYKERAGSDDKDRWEAANLLKASILREAEQLCQKAT